MQDIIYLIVLPLSMENEEAPPIIPGDRQLVQRSYELYRVERSIYIQTRAFSRR